MTEDAKRNLIEALRLLEKFASGGGAWPLTDDELQRLSAAISALDNEISDERS